VLSIFKRIPRNISKVRYLGLPVENEELARTEYNSGKTVLESLPPVVTFALTTFCNSRIPCVICDRNTRLPEDDVNTNEQVIEAVKPLMKTAKYVLLHCGGEPMFSKHFDDVILMIGPPTRVCFATNAMLLTKARTDRLLERDIMAGFVVSMDAATPEVYRIMRPSCDFQTVIENIKYYTQKADVLGRGHSTVTLNMTLCKTNVCDAPKLVDLAVSVGAKCVDYNHLNQGLAYTVKTADGWDWNYSDQADFEDASVHNQMVLEAYKRAKNHGVRMMFVGKPFLGSGADKIDPAITNELCGIVPFQESEKHVWKSEHHKLLAPAVPPCFKPWREAVIQPNGEIRECYFHELGQWKIGDILKDDFMAIRNSNVMISERQQFLKNAFSKRCAVSAPCVHRQRQ
jgi:radical SAM protein with 4Fe4S-binding SPASM domain